MDNLNPEWVKQFDVNYNFEVREMYKAVVYHIGDFNNLHDYGKHDLIGSVEFTLHEVVTQADQTHVASLICSDRPEGKSGMIEITGEEMKIS